MKDEDRGKILPREAVRLFTPKLRRHWHQIHIGVVVQQTDLRNWSLETISQRLLYPMIQSLMTEIPDDAFFDPEPWPFISGVHTIGSASWNGINIRYIEHYDIVWDSIFIRLDVRFHSNKFRRKEEWKRFWRGVKYWLQPWKWEWEED